MCRFFDNLQFGKRQVLFQVFAHARRSDAVLAAVNQQNGLADLAQEGTCVGKRERVKRGLQGGGRAVFHHVGQDGGDDFLAVRRVQQLQLQKLAHIFRVVLFEQGNHFVQCRSALPLRVVGCGEEFGKRRGQAQAADFVRIADGKMECDQPAE